MRRYVKQCNVTSTARLIERRKWSHSKLLNDKSLRRYSGIPKLSILRNKYRNVRAHWTLWSRTSIRKYAWLAKIKNKIWG